jgi:ribonucleoside-diphosphate reductase alpha chain
MRRITSGLMTGAGIGVVYDAIRPNGALVKGMGGECSGPISLMKMVNEAGRYIMQGGSRRAAIWAGLKWDHDDIFDFIRLKDWSQVVRDAKEADFNFPATMDGTNISVRLEDSFFASYAAGDARAHEVYWTVVRRMLKTGEPGFSVDLGENSDEKLRNACTEVTSADDNDICNLGSINLARITDPNHMRTVVDLATKFLLCGTLYSTVPYAEVDDTRTKNRRLGLGIMGAHEWLLKKGRRYEPNDELKRLLEIYQDQSDETACVESERLGISRPVKVRAIAPTGTISIIAETTSGIEPVYCVAFKRRYLKGNVWHAQYVVDAAAQRLIESGVSPEDIEDAVTLSVDVERRVAFQSWIQQFVDHGISSTINLPKWGSPENNSSLVQSFGQMLLQYLPTLRGITCYPDGARGGQPLNRVTYDEAVDKLGVEFEEHGNEQSCVSGACGI